MDDQARRLLEGTRELPEDVHIQTQPTFTWTCPRCGHQAVTLGVARIPDNCPACNHPDRPETPEQIAHVTARAREIAAAASLDEGDTGPEGRAIAEAQRLHALEEGGAAPALAEAEEQLVAGIAEPAAPVPSADAVALDEGWAAVCLAEAVDEVGVRAGAVDGGFELTEAQLAALVAAFVRFYRGDRWTMFCGCAAGAHANTFAGMEAAHPDRAKAR